MPSLVRAFAVLVTAIPVVASAQSSGPVDRGSWLVGGAGSLSRSTVEVGDNESSATTFSMNPDLLYFVANRIAIGARVGISWTSAENFDSHSWLLGPAARIYFAPSTAKTLPFVGLSVGMGSGSFEADVPETSETETSTLAIEGLAGFTWMVSRQVGITVEGFVQRDEDDVESGTVESESTRTSFGLRLGFAAFVFR